MEEMKRNDAREYTNLVGQHELQWKVTSPLGYDADLSEVMGEDMTVEETDLIYAAIAIPSNYEVVAWSTDPENSYPVGDSINSVENSDNYTVYYIETTSGTVVYGNNTPTYYITIAEK